MGRGMHIETIYEKVSAQGTTDPCFPGSSMLSLVCDIFYRDTTGMRAAVRSFAYSLTDCL